MGIEEKGRVKEINKAVVEQKGENQACFRRRNQLSEGRSKRWEEWEC